MIGALAAVSWSAGKDSMLALLRAREAGFDVGTLLTMCEPDGLSKSHALPPPLIAAQAAALGMAWMPARAPQGHYGECFQQALLRLQNQGHGHVVFGDIDLQAHRDWLEPACRDVGLEPVFPLWGQKRRALADEIVARGIRAQVVCVDTRWLDERFVGVEYDAAFLARLPHGVCPCGEDGEFHSFVWGGPGFAPPLALRPGPPLRVASKPPFAPTTFIFATPELA